MKIKKLGLLAFGKFKDKIIDLKDGINIIYAENEGGKSTCHSFIDGIFYGFSKDNLKSRNKDELFNKYKPWQGTDYKGFIEIEKRDLYRVFRDFNEDEVEVLNLTRGEDISDHPSFKKYSRIKEPGVYFFSMTRPLFKSTFYIRQMDSQIDKSAQETVKEKISNFLTSRDQDFSYKSLLKRLEGDLEDLGKDTRSKTKIGTRKTELEKIDQKKLIFEEDRKKYFHMLDFLRDEEEKLALEEKNYYRQKSSDFNKLKNEIKGLEEELSQNKENHISLEDFQRALEINKEIQANFSLIDRLNSNELEDLKEVNYDLEKDYFAYQKFRTEIDELNSINYSKEMEFLSKDLGASKKLKNIYLGLTFLGILLGFLIIIGSVYIKKYFLTAVSLIFFLYSYLRFVKFRVNRELVYRLKIRMDDLKNKSMVKTARKRNFDKIFSAMAKKYDLEDSSSLNEFLSSKMKINDKMRISNEYKLERKEDREKRNIELEEEIESLNKSLKDIFQKFGVENINDFKEKYRLQDLSLKENRLNNLKNKLEDFKDFAPEEFLEEFEDKNLDEIKENINNIKLNISKIKGQINALESSLEVLKNLNERQAFLKGELEKLYYQRDYTELALNNLKKILGENRQEILPKLREKIAEIISELTNNKYDEIFIDEGYNISCYDRENSKYVSLEDLSRGTCDQLYFAFRMAIIFILFPEDFPIILDDHFANYDDLRLECVLEYLKNFDQLIIFTSNKREIEILNKKQIDYNLINMR
ncbi:AAA family ATPase [uncultured Peptoniphilus sp.]|uniref:ATP-binding protein n=1 Tax=uncultured Peptoniphilus sp. TaxID=254354 RepID=UPI00280568C4|nr:AAA family ATPase [uncultured Peptoniphilus sp.]